MNKSPESEMCRREVKVGALTAGWDVVSCADPLKEAPFPVTEGDSAEFTGVGKRIEPGVK
jgi:hypothetical protein